MLAQIGRDGLRCAPRYAAGRRLTSHLMGIQVRTAITIPMTRSTMNVTAYTRPRFSVPFNRGRC